MSFFSWLEQDKHEPGHAAPEARYTDYKRVWEAARVPSPQPPDPTMAWTNLSARMEAVQKPRRFLTLRFALAFSVLLVLAVSLWWMRTPMGSEQYITSPGQRMTVNLPDQSSVSLNAASMLTYSRLFNHKNREVFLQGEAFFSVERGDYPFVIHTGIADVRVLGTKFNVYAREDLVRVGVREGTVEVSLPVDGVIHRRVLTAGQTIRCTRLGFASREPEAITYDLFPAWAHDHLLFDGEPLALVCEEVERYFGITIVLKNPKLAFEEVDGLLLARRPEDLIASLCRMIGADYRYVDGQYLIR